MILGKSSRNKKRDLLEQKVMFLGACRISWKFYEYSKICLDSDVLANTKNIVTKLFVPLLQKCFDQMSSKCFYIA